MVGRGLSCSMASGLFPDRDAAALLPSSGRFQTLSIPKTGGPPAVSLCRLGHQAPAGGASSRSHSVPAPWRGLWALTIHQGGSQGQFRLQRERLKFDKKEIFRGSAGDGRWTVGWYGCEEAVRPFSERIHTGYTCHGYCAGWGSRLPLCTCAYTCV